VTTGPTPDFGPGTGAAEPDQASARAAAPDQASARAAARERARELRDLHKQQDKRRKMIVTGLITAAVLLLVAVVVIVLILPRTETRGPQNMLSDGIKIGQELKVVQTPAQQPGQLPVPSPPNDDSVVDIQLYVDYLCSSCGLFEASNGEQLRSWASTGAATVEIHPLALLTTKSAGTQYSLRAASAAACVADLAPDHYFDFHDALLTNQPEEGSPGLTDEEMLDRAEAAGVTAIGQITRCVSEGRYKSWVKEATARALAGPIPNSGLSKIDAPLVILVNGQQFVPTADFDPAELAQFVVQASGDAFSENPTPTPGPSDTATPTPAP
jgi:protein-disulfide isomerase